MSLSAGQGKLYAVKIKLKAYLLLVFCCFKFKLNTFLVLWKPTEKFTV